MDIPSVVSRRTRCVCVLAVQMSHWNRSASLPSVIATRPPFGEMARFNGMRSESVN